MSITFYRKMVVLLVNAETYEYTWRLLLDQTQRNMIHAICIGFQRHGIVFNTNHKFISDRSEAAFRFFWRGFLCCHADFTFKNCCKINITDFYTGASSDPFCGFYMCILVNFLTRIFQSTCFFWLRSCTEALIIK